MHRNRPIMAKTQGRDKPPDGSVKSRLIVPVVIAGMIAGFSYKGMPPVGAKGEPPVQVEKMDVSSPFSRSLQAMLGINKLAAMVGNQQLEKQIHKKVEGDVDVNIEPYSATDLAEGKARRLEVTGQNLLYDKTFYVSDFHMITDEDTPLWVNLNTGKLKAPVEADFSVRLRQDDLNHSFETEKLQKTLQDIRIKLAGMGQQEVKVITPTVDFMPGRIRFKSRLAIAGASNAKALPIDIETGLEPEDKTGLVQFKDLTIAPIPGVEDMGPVRDFLAVAMKWLLNPSKLVPMKQGKLDVRSIVITPDELRLEGRVRLEPPPASPS